MIRIVPDTNIVVSGYRYGGNEYELLKAIHKREVVAYTSKEILGEIERVLNYPKLKIQLGDQKKIIEDFINKTKIVNPTQEILAVKDDTTDNKFIECAAEAKAHYIVSGDKHLLKIHAYKNIKIVKTKELLTLLKQEHKL